jgi:hypothetical protein
MDFSVLLNLIFSLPPPISPDAAISENKSSSPLKTETAMP